MLTKTILKKALNVKHTAIDNVTFGSDDSIIVRVHPTKGEQCRCGKCGRKAPRYDAGSGIRRWRTCDWIFWCAESANPANRKAPVRHMEISTTDFQCGEAAVSGIEDILRNGAMPSVHSLIAGSRPYTSLIER